MRILESISEMLNIPTHKIEVMELTTVNIVGISIDLVEDWDASTCAGLTSSIIEEAKKIYGAEYKYRVEFNFCGRTRYKLTHLGNQAADFK